MFLFYVVLWRYLICQVFWLCCYMRAVPVVLKKACLELRRNFFLRPALQEQSKGRWMVNQAVSLQCGINFTCEPFQIDVLKLYISNISNFRRHEKTLWMLRIPRIHSGCCPLTRAHAGKKHLREASLENGATLLWKWKWSDLSVTFLLKPLLTLFPFTFLSACRARQTEQKR